MVKDIPFIADVEKSAVGVAEIVVGVGFVGVAVEIEIAEIDKHTAVFEIAVGVVRHCVAEIMIVLRGVDKAVFAVHLADRTCLKERVGERALFALNRETVR